MKDYDKACWKVKTELKDNDKACWKVKELKDNDKACWKVKTVMKSTRTMTKTCRYDENTMRNDIRYEY